MKKYAIILAAATLTLAACTPNAPTEESIYLTEAEADEQIKADGGTLYTLDDFVSTYMTTYGVIFPVRERSYTYNSGYQVDPTDYTKNNRGWFSIDTIPSTGPGIYIRGRVVTEDYDGNFYKSLVIQQIVDGQQQALRLSVDISNAGGQYALGQMIQIRVNGLSIGKYANEPQLCVPNYNDNVYAYKSSEKVGWAPGRIPAGIFNKATRLIGKPDVSAIQYDDLTISDILSTPANDADYHKMDGRLVRIKDVHFAQKAGSTIPGMYEDYGTATGCSNGNPDTDKNSCVFAPYTENQGYPQGRIIDDGTGQTLVSTSEYAKFAHIILPTADYEGTIVGILGHYTDNGRNDPDSWDWSITLRSRYDLIGMTNEEGNTWEMKEYGE
ncbi:MAG: hypothetical protein IJV55_08715 [Paludibacteraceae bacterium]|nr:hypothetical protein [Paludibacteraceae bacterium]